MEHLAAGQPWAAWGEVRQLQRLDTYLAYLKSPGNPDGPIDEILSVESSVVAGGRVPDLAVRFASNPSQRVLVDTKLWSQTTLERVLSNTERFTKLVDQLRGYLSEPTDRVLIEFVKTARNPVTDLAPLRQRLSQVLTEGELQRLSLRVVTHLLEAPQYPS